MHRVSCTVVALVLTTACQGADIAQDTKKPARPKVPVRVNLRITNTSDQWAVGDQIAVSATVTNISDGKLFIPDWDQPSLKNQPMWRLHAEVNNFPDATKGSPITTFHGGTASVESSNGEQLGTGKTSRAKTGKFAVMLPGKMGIYATFSCTFLGVQRLAEQGPEHFSYPYRRAVVMAHDEESITIPAKKSPAMAAEYDRQSKVILGEDAPLKERLAVLGQVAAKKHYFAARFVWNIWKQVDDSKVKDAALLHLIGLLEFGTAYQAMPDLLDALAEKATPLEARKRMLDVLSKMYLTSKYPGFRIADMADYRLPEEVHRKALDVLRQLADSNEPPLAEKARQVLKPNSSGKQPPE